MGPKPRTAAVALPQKPRDTLSSVTSKATSLLTFLHTSFPLSPSASLPLLRPSPGRNSAGASLENLNRLRKPGAVVRNRVRQQAAYCLPDAKAGLILPLLLKVEPRRLSLPSRQKFQESPLSRLPESELGAGRELWLLQWLDNHVMVWAPP